MPESGAMISDRLAAVCRRCGAGRRRSKYWKAKWSGTPAKMRPTPRSAGQKLATKVLTMMPAVASRKKSGVTGYHGQRKGRGSSGSRRRSTITAATARP